MSDEPKRRSRTWIGWVLAAAFVLYPLSLGPACGLGIWARNDALFIALRFVYRPLWWACDRWPMLGAVIWPYETWWEALGSNR